MLSLAYLIQLLAPLIFFFSKNIYSCYLASSFFGITFMGVTHLSMQAASAINMENASSKMTLSYSAGQIFGPLVVLPLIKQTYDNAFLMSAFFISICIYICWYLKKNAEQLLSIFQFACLLFAKRLIKTDIRLINAVDLFYTGVCYLNWFSLPRVHQLFRQLGCPNPNKFTFIVLLEARLVIALTGFFRMLNITYSVFAQSGK